MTRTFFDLKLLFYHKEHKVLHKGHKVVVLLLSLRFVTQSVAKSLKCFNHQIARETLRTAYSE